MNDKGKVYVVTWEYPTSQDGEVAGVVGVAATEEKARELAEAEGREMLTFRPECVVYIAGEHWTPEDGYDANITRPGADWDLWISYDSWEVQR